MTRTQSFTGSQGRRARGGWEGYTSPALPDGDVRKSVIGAILQRCLESLVGFDQERVVILVRSGPVSKGGGLESSLGIDARLWYKRHAGRDVDLAVMSSDR